ncbi:MAG: Ig-like domain-containing protein, partial [Vicinamibacterales bacterium]
MRYRLNRNALPRECAKSPSPISRVARTLVAICALLFATTPVVRAEVLTGSYTGNGSDNRAITGLGFQPDVVLIKAATAQIAVIRSSSMSGDASKKLEGANAHVADRIQSLDAGGFTVGTNAQVNSNGTTYHWIAFKVRSGSMHVGTYSGNGSSQSLTGVGFSPELVIIWNESTTQAVFRTSSMTTTYDFAGGAPFNTRITSLDADGFTVGTSTRTNGSGSTYHYVAWNEIAAVTKSGSYTGNGTDNHSISGVGFQPEYLLVKGLNAGGNYWTEQKTDSTGASTDAALEFGAWGVETGEIKALESDGFKVGTSNESNQNAETYAYFAWVQQSGAPTISDIASQSTNISTATSAIAFTVGDADVAASMLTVTASSSNTTLVPNGNITLGGSGANRTITLTPATGQTGTSTITVTVSDGELTASDTFIIGVTAPTQAVQSGTATISASSTSTTATITQVNLNRAFLVFSTTIDDANPANAAVRGELTDPTTVTFTRYGTTGAVSITWSVVEYASGVTVQRGTSTTMGAATTNDVTITSVTTTKAFPLISWSIDGVVHGANDYPKAKLTSSTNLQVATTVEGGSNQTVSWQVVEFSYGATVQSGDLSFATTDSSKTATVTSVNTAKSWLVFTHTSDDGTSANIGQKLVRGVVTNATTLTFDRANTGQAMDLTWYLIEFSDNPAVQHGSQSFTTAE